jgi:hypothetical protein
MIAKPKAVDNAKLIKKYIEQGSSGNEHFDLRVQLTSEGLRQVVA